MIRHRKYGARSHPYTRHVRGKGNYLDFGGKYSRAFLGGGGRALGNLLPIPGAGDFLGSIGDSLGGLFHKYTGIGDYRRKMIMRRRLRRRC